MASLTSTVDDGVSTLKAEQVGSVRIAALWMTRPGEEEIGPQIIAWFFEDGPQWKGPYATRAAAISNAR